MKESIFNKIAGLKPPSMLRKDSSICFPANRVRCLRTTILWNSTHEHYFRSCKIGIKTKLYLRKPDALAFLMT